MKHIGGCDWLRKDTEEFAVLGFRPHAAELLFVAAEAPGVVTDLLWTQTTVPVQHLEGNVRVDLWVEPGTLQLCKTAGRRRDMLKLLTLSSNCWIYNGCKSLRWTKEYDFCPVKSLYFTLKYGSCTCLTTFTDCVFDCQLNRNFYYTDP